MVYVLYVYRFHAHGMCMVSKAATCSIVAVGRGSAVVGAKDRSSNRCIWIGRSACRAAIDTVIIHTSLLSDHQAAIYQHSSTALYYSDIAT
jgi:hypothetical protein